MHPDQQYSVRNLQHADLLAEAERERMVRQAAPSMPARSFQGWGMRALAAGTATALLAVAVTLPWGGQPSAQAQSRPVNRIFADEARYVPSIEEYLAVLPTAPEQADLIGARNALAQPNARLECQAALLPGMALCTPSAVSEAPQSASAHRAGGPR